MTDPLAVAVAMPLALLVFAFAMSRIIRWYAMDGLEKATHRPRTIPASSQPK
jgi:hypothetical protein